jgi:tRNA(Arg) A34 adenosine deaminase TadA
MWETLAPPWQAALEMAWEAYRAGTIPIGAAIADCNGNVVARGRNRIFDVSAPAGQVWGNTLAHAEMNALLELKLDQESRHSAALYSTMEPCPLCLGALYMSSVRTLHFAARDPYAGSTNILGTTLYLSRKPIQIVPPEDERLENALMAMIVDVEIRRRGEAVLSSKFFHEWREVLPAGVELGVSLFYSGELHVKQDIPVGLALNWLVHQVQ